MITAPYPTIFLQRLTEYRASQARLKLLSLDIHSMLAAWLKSQGDQSGALAWLHSQPFQGLGIVIPLELLPQLPARSEEEKHEGSRG